MGYKKNDTVEVRIVDMSTKGEGIGKADGYTLFVKDTVIGDLASVKVMKAKKNYGYARLMEILEPSPHRVRPVCPMARQCGGCQLQFMDYQEQIRFKENLIRNNLMKIGGFDEVPMLPMLAMEEPFGYRNKAQFPIGTDKDGKIIAGFYAGRTHSIVANRKCYLGVDVNEQILDAVIEFM